MPRCYITAAHTVAPTVVALLWLAVLTSGLVQDESSSNITKAFRKLARKHHPDKRQDKDDDNTFKLVRHLLPLHLSLCLPLPLCLPLCLSLWAVSAPVTLSVSASVSASVPVIVGYLCIYLCSVSALINRTPLSESI